MCLSLQGDVPGYYAPCSGRVRIDQLKKYRQLIPATLKIGLSLQEDVYRGKSVHLSEKDVFESELLELRAQVASLSPAGWIAHDARDR